jgi:hypothetical protein
MGNYFMIKIELIPNWEFNKIRFKNHLIQLTNLKILQMNLINLSNQTNIMQNICKKKRMIEVKNRLRQIMKMKHLILQLFLATLFIPIIKRISPRNFNLKIIFNNCNNWLSSVSIKISLNKCLKTVSSRRVTLLIIKRYPNKIRRILIFIKDWMKNSGLDFLIEMILKSS